MNNKISNNAIYSIIKSVSAIIFPIITYPYITRILMPENIGKINYASSIANYFALFSALGVNTYAIREGSKIRDRILEFNSFASEVFSINIFSTIVSYILLTICLISVRQFEDYRLLIVINSLSMCFTTLGCEWINNVFEDFKYITIRTVVFQFVSVACMFLLVHTKDDYIIYTVINVIANSGANLCNFFYRRKYCNIKFTFNLNLKTHLKSISYLFAIIFIQTVYVNSDITILGWFMGDTSVGIYSVAVKIYSLINVLVGSIAMVVIPKMSKNFGEGNIDKINSLVSYALHMISFVGFPCLIGVNCITPQIIGLIAGNEFLDAIIPLHMLTIASALSYAASIVINIILVPSGKEKVALKAAVFSALFNVVFNIILIPHFGILAAASTTILSEIISLVVTVKHIDPGIKIINISKNLIIPFLSSLIILPISILTRRIFTSNFVIIIVTVILSIISYLLLLFSLKDEIINEYLPHKYRRK